ncbi:hypothetical protein C0585_06740 [Candidatus Woesearchaeota archaeon]|nr:MAG: hypothetical protein C0585_06740 [Candidatus Woesearchaeota archaeon]
MKRKIKILLLTSILVLTIIGSVSVFADNVYNEWGFDPSFEPPTENSDIDDPLTLMERPNEPVRPTCRGPICDERPDWSGDE